MMNDALGEVAVGGGEFALTDEDMIASIATEIATEQESQGKSLKWPPGMSNEEAYEQADFPPAVWSEAAKRWGEVPAAEQQAQKEAQEQFRNEMLAQFADAMKEEGFKASFNPFDLLWLGLAAFTAYGVGSGGAGDD